MLPRWSMAAGVGLIMLAACEGGKAPAPTATTGAAAVVTPPSQILKDFDMQDMQAGIKTMTLKSIEGRLFDATQMAEVEKPTVTFYKQGTISSVLNAPQGLVNMQTHDVDAWGGVTVVTTDSSTLTTERLHYDPKRCKILTKEHVRLDKPDSLTEGIGLEADPDLTDVKIGRQTVHMKKASKT